MHSPDESRRVLKAAEYALEAGQLERAEQLARELLRDDLDHVGALRVLGRCCIAQGRERSALLCYEKLTWIGEPTEEDLERVAQLRRGLESVGETGNPEKPVDKATPGRPQEITPQADQYPESGQPTRTVTVSRPILRDLITQEGRDKTPPVLTFLSLFSKTLLAVILVGLIVVKVKVYLL